MAGETESKAMAAKHIMISYQWDAKKRMIKLRDKLKLEGYNVWMDINNMGGDTLACMGKAVEEAAAVIICVSKKYKESLNCKGDTDESLDRIFPDLLRELGDKGKMASIEKWSPVKYEKSKALDCSICLDRFRNPKTLPCLHSFCEKCLQSWAPQGTETISCPQCRRNFNVPNGDVTQFPTNFHLKELVEEDTLREQFTGDGSNGNEFPCTCCDVGKQSRVVARCQNCNLYICTSGLSAHKSQVELQDHKVIVFKAANREETTQSTAIGQNLVKENAQFEPKSSDWEIFDTMYDEDRSNNLLRYWMQLREGDTQWQDGMVNHYQACLQRLEENPEISKDTLAQRQQQVAHVFMLAGQYDKAMELVEKALDMELNELGKRQEKLADLHYLQSVICEEILRGTSYADEMDAQILKKCIQHARASLKLRRDLEGNDNKYKLGKVLMVVSSALGYLADYNRLKTQLMDKAKKEARKHIDEAIEIFTQLKAKGNLASAMKIKANLEEDGSDEQEKLYRDALEMCEEALGESSVLSERLHWNMSTLFKGRKNFPEAYTWLVKCREICEKIYGQYHPRTQQVNDNLELPEYADLRRNESQ